MNISVRGPNRTPPTWRQVLNPWWHLSDDEKPPAWPWLLWAIGAGNFATNCKSVVIGIAHRTRTVYVAHGDGHTFTEGWNRGYIQAAESNLRLPFVSYRGRWVEFKIGWETNGAFTWGTLRRANATGAGPTP